MNIVNDRESWVTVETRGQLVMLVPREAADPKVLTESREKLDHR